MNKEKGDASWWFMFAIFVTWALGAALRWW
jgi:hypothetical protein